MLSRLKPQEGWIALLLVTLLVFIVALSLQAAEWTDGMYLISTITLVGVLVGIVAAKSDLSGLITHPLAMATGVAVTLYHVMSLAAPAPWRERLIEVLVRLARSVILLSSGQRSLDTLPFVVIIGLLMWLIAYGAVWDYFRAHNIWGVLLPSGIAVLVNTYYARPNLTPLLLFYAIVALLLIIRATLQENERRWSRRDIRYSHDILIDFMRDGAMFAVALVVVAWLMPGFVRGEPPPSGISVLAGPWGTAQRTVGRFFGTLNYQQATTASSSWFGDSMTFRGPVNQTNQLIMRVRAPEGRYWRAVVNDTYTGLGWVIGEKTLVDGPEANAPFPVAVPEGRTLVPQEYTMEVPAGQLLFAAGQVVQVSLPTKLQFNGPADGGLASEPVKLYANESLTIGQTYSVVSAIPTVDISSLRNAGTDYPAGILERYTALPPTVPTAITELAQQLTASAATPYDKASLLETYLRSFPYNESIPGPNPGEDGVEYFLFREKQGYCDYYASAMAVMLRTLGVPSRVVRGYNQGTLMPTGEYEIRQTNAHTWVEVYFPLYGWIEFEPTAAEPALSRPIGEATPVPEDDALDASVPQVPPISPQEQQAQEQDEAEAAGGAAQGTGRSLVVFSARALLTVGAIVMLAIAAVTAANASVQRRWRGLRPIERLYDQAGLFGRAIGNRPDPTLTPHEYMERMGNRVPEARSPLLRLADLFTKQRFSRGALGEGEEAEARTAWQQARQRLVRYMTAHLRPRPPKQDESKGRRDS